MKMFTPLFVIALVAFAVAPCVQAQGSSADSEAIKTKLTQMENDWVKALTTEDHGVAALGDLVADDYAGVNPDGVHQDKAAMIDETKKDSDTVSSAENENMNVHVYAPNLATVCGNTKETGKDKHGKAFNRTYAWVDTWMERDGKWQCIAEAITLAHKKK
jgi:hypothetical protein